MTKPRLKNDDYVTAMVLASLLAKGRPETRLAKHLRDKKYTEKRAIALLDKLNVSEDFQRLIIDRFRTLGQKEIAWYEHDSAQLLAGRIEKRLGEFEILAS